MTTLNEGLKIDYTMSEGVFLTYEDKSQASTSIQETLYTDNLTLVAESRGDLQHMVNAIDSACEWWGMTISATKSKDPHSGGAAVQQPAIHHAANPTPRRGEVLPLSWQ